MSAPKYLENIITWMIVLGFAVFCIGYLYVLIDVMQIFPSELWPVLIGGALILLSFFGLKIFRRFFVAQEQK
jgi:hypothetical protein